MRLYAFEANPDTFERLCRPDAQTSIKAEQVALSDHAGRLEFIGGAVSHVFTSIENKCAYHVSGETTSVLCTRLDDCEIVGDSIVMKIDVEGQEMEVLNGARRLFEQRRVKAVYIDGYVDAKLPEFLRAAGFELRDGRTLEPTDGKIHSLLAVRVQSA